VRQRQQHRGARGLAWDAGVPIIDLPPSHRIAPRAQHQPAPRHQLSRRARACLAHPSLRERSLAMPPRRSARVAAVAERASSALAPLPLTLALAIFSLLPVDCRLRCAEVCRAWRAALSEVSLWTRLDVSAASGLAHRVTDALLHAATAKARGGLTALDLSGCDGITEAALRAVAAANAGALRELRAYSVNSADAMFCQVSMLALLRAAPRLRLLAADAECCLADAEGVRALLRNEGVFAPVRLWRFQGYTRPGAPPPGPPVDVAALAADVAAHAWLEELVLTRLPLDAAALEALAGAARARRLSAVCFDECSLLPACAPPLARLLGGNDALATLTVLGSGTAPLLDAAAGAPLFAALRASRALTSLSFVNVDAWRDAAAGAALLGALTAHPRLRHLDLRFNFVAAHAAAAGGALAALSSPQTRPRCSASTCAHACWVTPACARCSTRCPPTRTCACCTSATT
jgi:hypothetical protein